MSYEIRFNSEKLPRYILRLRSTPSGIIDLCGNRVTNHNVDYTSTASTLGSGTAMKFNGTNAYLEVRTRENFGLEDLTVSVQVRNLQHWGDNSSYRNGILIDSAYYPYFGLMAVPFKENNYYLLSCDCNDQFNNHFKIIPKISTNPSTTFHLAVVKVNGVLKMFYNGILQSTSSSDSPNVGDKVLHSKNNAFHVGYYALSSMTYKYLFATLDDVCIIKGKALWTSNFTPPTSYLPDDLESI